VELYRHSLTCTCSRRSELQRCPTYSDQDPFLARRIARPPARIEGVPPAVVNHENAVTDGIISSSPCKIEGAGTEHAAERPIASAEEIELLSEAMPEHLRIVVPLPLVPDATKRILGLRRMDVDLRQGVISILQSRTSAWMVGRL